MIKLKGYKLNEKQAAALEEVISSLKALHEIYDDDDPHTADSADTFMVDTENFLFELGVIKERKIAGVE